MLRGTKVRIYPTREQEAFLTRQFGAVRFVWNKALAVMGHRYRVHGESLSAKHDMKPLLAVAKRSRRYGWLKEADSMALQQALLNLDAAFQGFFEGKAGYPRFKTRHGRQSSYHCTGKTRVVEGGIEVPKIGGVIRAKLHRAVEGEVRSITLSRSVMGKYYASILVDDGRRAPRKPTVVDGDAVVGVDLGLTAFAVDSRGRKVPNPRHLERALTNLRRKQRKLSRTRRGSSRRAKARRKVAGAHERVRNARADFLHQLSHGMVDESQAIVLEDLGVRGMMKCRWLSRAIGQAGWHELRRMITYKAEAAGVHLVIADRFEPSSKTCHACGQVNGDLALDDRIWQCPNCRIEHDRDLNAALNLKRIGILELKASGLCVSARGGTVRPSSPGGHEPMNRENLVPHQAA
jgi:putative transposase